MILQQIHQNTIDLVFHLERGGDYKGAKLVLQGFLDARKTALEFEKKLTILDLQIDRLRALRTSTQIGAK